MYEKYETCSSYYDFYFCVNHFLERPVITKNNKASEVVPRHKERYSTPVGSSISSPASIAITIVCAAKGEPTPKISWTWNGRPVPLSRKVKVLRGGQRLRIKSLSSKEIGRYECTAKNEFGADTAASNINIKGKFE